MALEVRPRVNVDPGKQPDLGLQSRFVGKCDEDSCQWTKTTPKQCMLVPVRRQERYRRKDMLKANRE